MNASKSPSLDSQLERLLRNGPLAISLTTVGDGRFADVNECYLQLFGYTRDEVIGRTSVELDVWESPEKRAEVLGEFRREGRVSGRQMRWRARSGVLIESTTSLERLELAGQPYVLAIVCDQSAQRQALDDRDLLFALLPIFLCVAGTDGYFRRVNPAFERVLGYTIDELLAAPFIDFVHPDDREATIAEVQRLSEGATTVSFENRYRCKDGNYRWLSWDSIPIREEGLIYAAARDVTAQHEAAEEARVARWEAEQANYAKSEFLSRMSHELRTPLNAILGFGQLLELDDLPGEQGDGVKQILKAGRHLLGLIDEVLDIARIESGRTSMSIEPVYVSELVADSVGLMGPAAERRRIALNASAATCDGLVMADRQRTQQVLLNLLSNAIKYNVDGGSVSISCTESGDRIRLSVVDTGSGIPARMQERLFTPFDRLGAEMTEVEGTGLGLPLAKALVEAMGGALGVDSTTGEGTTAWFELPCADERSLEDAAALSPTPIQMAADGKAWKVLCIEDNLSSYTLVERVLERLAGVEVVAAMQGGIGIELARDVQPDLILLDLNLPDMHGSDVLAALRAEPATRDIAVIILTADATSRETRRLMEAGAYAYLTKPFDIQRFLGVVEAALRGETPHAA